MFEKLRKFFEAKKEQHEYNYNVTQARKESFISVKSTSPP